MTKKILFDHLIGTHLSIRGSYLNIFKEAADLDITVIACFTAPKLRYDLNEFISEEVISQFRSFLITYRVFSHAGYLINIANKDKKENYHRSMLALKAEIIRCQLLGITGIAFHPGSNEDEKKGLLSIIETINALESALSEGSVKLLIESSAGQGNTLPWSLEQLAYIFEGLKKEVKPFVGVVLDTCHLFAAGYDITTKHGVNDFFSHFDRMIGVENIQLIHLNDSKFLCGSRLDRHETLGKGKIGLEGLLSFITHQKLQKIPKILETPVDSYLDWIPELALLNERLSEFL
jgi:deoxyribonuclease-4